MTFEPTDLHDLFDRAVGLPPADRATFLDEACRDPILRREIDRLLAAHDRQESLFDTRPQDELVPPSPTAPKLSLKTGALLGPYQIVAALGAGGMGEVYKARDTRLNRTVALKVLSQALIGDAAARHRLEREARAAAALAHPHICTLLDIGRQDDTEYLVMEYLDGETLGARISRRRFTPAEALAYGIQIAEALAAAHQAGIVHRDLKPANIMLTKAGVKLLDFGLAKPRQPVLDDATGLQREPLTRAGTILGTLQYMAPEQLEGREADARTDIFAFGTVLYEMLTATKAFEASSDAALIGRIIHEPLPELPVTQFTFAPLLNRLIRRCSEKDPDDRFQSAKDVAFSLEDIAKTSASEVTNVPPLSRRSVRAALAVGICGAIALGILGLLVGRRLDPHVPMSFRQVTWRHGNALSGRFGPDGHSVIYGGAWDGTARELFVNQPGSRESLALGVVDADILAVSSRGELAVGQGVQYDGSLLSQPSTLSRLPLSGGAPRALMDGVTYADWSPEGNELAVARRVGGRMRLEFPIGTKLFETPNLIAYPKVSRDGRFVAFAHYTSADDGSRGSVHLVSRTGSVTVLSENLFRLRGLVWSPRGDEIWFTFQDNDGGSPVRAVTPGKRSRVLERLPGWAVLQDATPQGQVLVSRERIRVRMFVHTRDTQGDREVSWLDGTNLNGVSADRKLLLLTEAAAGGGPGFSTYLRRIDNSPAVRLEEGWGVALSPDGRMAIIQSTLRKRLLAVPTGAGTPRELPIGGITGFAQDSGAWLPDGKLIYQGRDAQGIWRLFVQKLDGGLPEPTAATLSDRDGSPGWWTLSPDGSKIIVNTTAGPAERPLDSGTAVPVPNCKPADRVVAWNDDGIFVLSTATEAGIVIDRIEPRNGQRRFWRKLVPPDAAGIVSMGVGFVLDSETYSYGLLQDLSELVVVNGLK